MWHFSFCAIMALASGCASSGTMESSVKTDAPVVTFDANGVPIVDERASLVPDHYIIFHSFPTPLSIPYGSKEDDDISFLSVRTKLIYFLDHDPKTPQGEEDLRFAKGIVEPEIANRVKALRQLKSDAFDRMYSKPFSKNRAASQARTIWEAELPERSEDLLSRRGCSIHFEISGI